MSKMQAMATIVLFIGSPCRTRDATARPRSSAMASESLEPFHPQVTHQFWGDRTAASVIRSGTYGWIQARVEAVDEAEMARRQADPEWTARTDDVQTSLGMPRP